MGNYFITVYSSFLKKSSAVDIQRERQGERRREWSLSLCASARDRNRSQVCALTGNQAGHLLVHRAVLNLLSHSSRTTVFHFHRSLLEIFQADLLPIPGMVLSFSKKYHFLIELREIIMGVNYNYNVPCTISCGHTPITRVP